MECSEARSLIDRGISPGPRTPLSTQLGFHLAHCAACRAYREQQQHLLANLLLTPQASLAPAPAAVPAPVPPKPRNLLWIASLVLLLALPSAALLWGLGIWWRTEQNLTALIITPASVPSRATSEPQRAGGIIGPIPPLLSVQATPTATTLPVASLQPTRTPATTVPSVTVTPVLRLSPSPWPTLQASLPSPTPLPPTAEPPPSGEATTILLLGSDRRPGETGIPRTDSIMVLRVDPQQQRIALLSLPRDLWVEIPGYGPARINAAYVWGELYGAPGGGMGLARATVSNLLGIPVDYVVTVDFQGFIGLIDTLGGINVDVEKELYDAQFPTMDYGYTVAHFLPGPQQMDGLTALTYSRIRHPDSDFMRIRRQQAVLIGIANRVRERGDLQNLISADQITGALLGFVQTDIPRERVLGLIWAMRNLDAALVERYALSEMMVSFGVGADRYALVPSSAALTELVGQFMGAP